VKYLVLAALLFLSGCSHFTFNKQMCQNIEPGENIPQECVPYDEEAIEKAFEGKKQKTDTKDLIEFQKKKQ